MAEEKADDPPQDVPEKRGIAPRVDSGSEKTGDGGTGIWIRVTGKATGLP